MILYIQYTDPAAYPPLEHSSLILAERGWRVRHLGVTAGGAARQLALPHHPRIAVELMPASGPGLAMATHYARFLAWCCREIGALRPEVVYCSDLRSFPIGLWASTRLGTMTILHEHDPPPASAKLLMRLMLNLRGRFARRATLIVIPQYERAEKFQADTGVNSERIRIVYNCPSLSELVEICPHQKPLHDGVVLWYHGSIGPGLLPPTTVEALARLPEDVELEIAGYETISSKGYVAQLLARARELGVGERLRYHGPLRRSDLLRRAAGAHVGLALFASAFGDPMVGASNKPFDYLACGLALLTNQTPEWESFFGAAGVSIGCDPANADDIARAVLYLRNDPGRRQAMAARGRALIRTTWNYETQFAKVLAALEPGVPGGSKTAARQSAGTE